MRKIQIVWLLAICSLLSANVATFGSAASSLTSLVDNGSSHALGSRPALFTATWTKPITVDNIRMEYALQNTVIYKDMPLALTASDIEKTSDDSYTYTIYAPLAFESMLNSIQIRTKLLNGIFIVETATAIINIIAPTFSLTVESNSNGGIDPILEVPSWKSPTAIPIDAQATFKVSCGYLTSNIRGNTSYTLEIKRGDYSYTAMPSTYINGILPATSSWANISIIVDIGRYLTANSAQLDNTLWSLKITFILGSPNMLTDPANSKLFQFTMVNGTVDDEYTGTVEDTATTFAAVGSGLLGIVMIGVVYQVKVKRKIDCSLPQNKNKKPCNNS